MANRLPKKITAENTKYSNTSIGCTLLNLDFTVTNYCKELVYDELDTTLAVM